MVLNNKKIAYHLAIGVVQTWNVSDSELTQYELEELSLG
jgi:hypothetical protein